MFENLKTDKYQMLDFEAGAILPVLAEYSGKFLQAELKELCKELIQTSLLLYPPCKVWNCIMRALDSKHPASKVACLGLLCEIVKICGMKVATARDVKAFGKFLVTVPEGGQEVKNECLNLLCEIYRQKGEGMWSNLGDYVGRLAGPNKDAS